MLFCIKRVNEQLINDRNYMEVVSQMLANLLKLHSKTLAFIFTVQQTWFYHIILLILMPRFLRNTAMIQQQTVKL